MALLKYLGKGKDKYMNKYQRFHTKNDWENINITAINREPSHVYWGAYENAAQAESCDRTVSKWTGSLDGVWKFAYYEKPSEVDTFWENGFDHSDWKDIKVPGNWELQGFGYPIYTNIPYPWDYYSKEKHMIYPTNDFKERGLPNPPYIPEENPTGCYFRTFTISPEWMNREIFIHFKGVETAYYLWINGVEVGYSQDSKLPAEFNITPYIKEGENTVSVQVMKFAGSTYMEDQDYWHISGIFRSVLLFAKPKARIVDWKIDAIPDLYYSFGTVKADIEINRFNGYGEYKVQLDIMDMKGTILATGTSNFNTKAEYRLYEAPTTNTARIILKVEQIEKWNPETPILYKAVMSLISPTGEKVDYESCRIGFKKVEIVNGIILLNGKRLIVRGVNRHEHEAFEGRTVSVEHMIEEIKQMKRLNINSVRTCHYPDDPIWYDLCDEWGLLLICETNLETHDVLGELTQNPSWATNFLERAIRMVLTHKNHASIYSWSLGNESGVGANHAAMAGWIREYDPTCLCQYEAGEPGKSISDIRGTMYAPQGNILDKLTDVSDSRPIVLVEYLYQIRNSGGGMHKFLDLVEKYQRFQGGYIWDWQDKCLIAKTTDGQEFLGYGGDFNESVVEWKPGTPTFMTNNGIVLPDLTPKPAGIEAKQVYCPIIFTEIIQNDPWNQKPLKEGSFKVKNRNLVLDTKNYSVVYAVRENGYVIKEGNFDLPYLKAGEEANIEFTVPVDKKPNSEYHVEFSVRYAQNTTYAEAGYELACYQFALESGAYSYDSSIAEDLITLTTTEADITIEHQVSHIQVSSSKFEILFDKNTGAITSFHKNGVNYLESGPIECFSRPYTGIDATEDWGRFPVWSVFENKNKNAELKYISAECIGNKGVLVSTIREVTFTGNPYGILVSSQYIISSAGDINVRITFNVDPSLRDMTRIGAELVISEGFEELEYYGLGPVENYMDRKNSARMGVFKSSVEAEHFPFIPPSENGGHEKTRWITLANKEGKTIKIKAPIPFHFDAHHNTIEDYKSAKHEHELLRRKESYIHIDAAHSGIGSDMGFSVVQVEENRVIAQNYVLEFTISVD